MNSQLADTEKIGVYLTLVKKQRLWVRLTRLSQNAPMLELG